MSNFFFSNNERIKEMGSNTLGITELKKKKTVFDCYIYLNFLWYVHDPLSDFTKHNTVALLQS